MVGSSPVKHCEMGRPLTIIDDQRLDPEPGAIGRGEVEEGIHIAPGGVGHTKLQITAVPSPQAVLNAAL
jgi:hypothetical protein